MDDRELELNRRELEAYLRGEERLSQSFIGQPYNGIASNIYHSNMGANGQRRLYDQTYMGAIQHIQSPSTMTTKLQGSINDFVGNANNLEDSLLLSQQKITQRRLDRLQQDKSRSYHGNLNNTIQEGSIPQLFNNNNQINNSVQENTDLNS